MAEETTFTPLWATDHAYYCSERAYNTSGDHLRYRSWGAFIEEEGDAADDYNLIFRWDWYEGGEDGLAGSPFGGDVNYRNGSLRVFYMGQRKGYFRMVEVEVCRADEPAVRQFLQTKWEYLADLWSPLGVPARGTT